MTARLLSELVDDHNNMRKLLGILERQRDVFTAGGHPDWDLLEDITEYCLDYPDRYHHPKEDLVFQKIRERNTERAKGAGNFIAQHAKLAAEAQAFAKALKAIRLETEVPRERLTALLFDFVETYRTHMAMEEEFFFPAADLTLTAADWHTIRAEAARFDPLFGGEVHDRFKNLRAEILEWDRLNAATS